MKRKTRSVKTEQKTPQAEHNRAISDASFRRLRASIMRRYALTFELLAAHDRGECDLRTL